MDHDTFLKIKPELTKALAIAFETKLLEMGDKAKEISWFSSVPFNTGTGDG